MDSSVTKSATLVLSPGTEIAPISAFPEEIQSSLGGARSDFILSVRGSRLGSQRIDAETAAFLRLFVKPSRIVDAVLGHALTYKADPSEVLEDAYMLVASLRNQGILIEPTDPASIRPDAGLPEWPFGDVVRVLRCVRALADTEVYEASLLDGARVAVKYVLRNASPPVKRALEHESGILSEAHVLMPGSVPTPIASDLDREDPYLVLAWCDGQAIDVVVREERMVLADRIRIVLNLLAAYVKLHGAGVLHGDVQPNNVLVDHGGAVALVDFGGASLLPTRPVPQRLWFLPTCEPELATAHLKGGAVPLPTEAGEQYCVAVLAYLVLTGKTYLPLALETELALRQIVQDEPRPFSDSELLWPLVERILRRALAKDPQDRYPTFAEFARALRDAIVDSPAPLVAIQPKNRQELAPPAIDQFRDFQRCAADLTTNYGLTAELTERGLSRGPTASVYHGAAGIAYALLRLGYIREDAEIIAAADIWIEKALALRKNAGAFSGIEMGLLPNMTNPRSILNGHPGLFAIQALVRHVSGDPSGCDAAVRGFISSAGTPTSSNVTELASSDMSHLDVAHGAAGLLLGAALLLPVCRFRIGSLEAELRAYGSVLRASVEVELVSAGLGDSHFARGYLGFAHGRAGAIYSLLRWSEAAGDPLSSLVEGHLDYLASASIQHENMRAWPIESGGLSSPPWSGWCHGSAGHALLWLAAARAYSRPYFRTIAVAAGEHIWGTRSNDNASLCCGLSGEALVLFDLARATANEEWAERGRVLVRRAIECRFNDNVPHSLFRGGVGISLAAIEALAPFESRWPLWQPFP